MCTTPCGVRSTPSRARDARVVLVIVNDGVARRFMKKYITTNMTFWQILLFCVYVDMKRWQAMISRCILKGRWSIDLLCLHPV